MATALDLARSERGRKAIRYTLVSGVSVVVAAVALFILSFFFHWTDRSAAIASAVAGGIPNYYLNRRWAWGRTGRSHLWREIVPFWVIAFVGLAFSTWTTTFAGSIADTITDHRLLRSVIVVIGMITGYGILWIVKFILFNRVLFVDRSAPGDVPPV